MLDEIAKQQTITLNDETVIEWNQYDRPLVGQMVVYCYDIGEFYFDENVQMAESNVWQPNDDDESEYSESQEPEE